MELDTKSLEESQGPLEKIPCTGEVDPTEETHETFQEGFFEEIQTPRGIAGCIIGILASVVTIFGPIPIPMGIAAFIVGIPIGVKLAPFFRRLLHGTPFQLAYSYLSNKRACIINYFGLFFHPARTYCMPARLTIFQFFPPSTLNTCLHA